MFVSTQNTYIEVLTPKVMAPGWGLWKVIRSPGWGLNVWDYCLYITGSREILHPLIPHEDSEKSTLFNLEEGLHQDMTMLIPYLTFSLQNCKK